MKKVGFLIIGDEILCGKTRDINLQTLALMMGEKGYQIGETRIISDDEDEIIKNINALREKYFLVITSGGIGPTHDDITTESIAKAFNLKLELNEEAKNELASYCKQAGLPLNEARLKMATLPIGAKLIYNKQTKAPGFQLQNVCVLAGIPIIFNGMLEEVLKTMEDGVRIYSTSIETQTVTEGVIATELSAIQKKFKGYVYIGSYPKFDEAKKASLQITFRSADKEKAERCKDEVLKMINELS